MVKQRSPIGIFNQIEYTYINFIQGESSNFMKVGLINGWMMNVHCHCMYQKQCKVAVQKVK